jgi:hypothetical protein
MFFDTFTVGETPTVSFFHIKLRENVQSAEKKKIHQGGRKWKRKTKKQEYIIQRWKLASQLEVEQD